ncbi:hypothetical protein UPTC4110_1437 [Campylobacter lari CCUG 22395]|uniref:hypothetical protein n=1 Tax=Campylobacter lari TaxID=201 RepID=UPI00057F8C31|nr:hypothetical protein [Campylobacter lari]AJD03969.1 hypothetical protein UPTC4110_1437 [Campylobacter lari CCUG 22395]EGK8048227.1 hypothetical protein [Campylobacter lari]MCV3458728.1 hypothetical protein [Campylobacter lari]
MVNIYQVKIIENFCKDKFKKDTRTKDFFHTFLAQNLEIYTNIEDQKYAKDTILIYKIFDICIICIKDGVSVSQEYCQFKKGVIDHIVVYTDENMNDGKISQLLRGSSTLKIDKSNCYDNPDIKVVFSEKGFLLQAKFNNCESKFNDTMTMFALSLAYREKMEHYLNLTSSIIDKENYHDVIDIKKDFYIFNLKYFFSNPVHYNYQQKHAIWKIIFQYYNILEQHQELKIQIENLVDILHIEQNQEENKKEKIKENKRKKIEMIFLIIGGFVTLASLVSAYKDAKELFG